MTTKILTQSTLILQPTLKDNARAADIAAADIKWATKILHPPTVIDLPPTDYTAVTWLSRLLALIDLFFAPLVWSGDLAIYLVDGAGSVLESAINRASGIISGIRRLFVDMIIMAFPVRGVCYVA